MLIINTCHALNSIIRMSIHAEEPKVQRSSAEPQQDLLPAGAAPFPCRPGGGHSIFFGEGFFGKWKVYMTPEKRCTLGCMMRDLGSGVSLPPPYLPVLLLSLPLLLLLLLNRKENVSSKSSLKGAIRQQRFYSPAPGGPGSYHTIPTPHPRSLSPLGEVQISPLWAPVYLFSPSLDLRHLDYLVVGRQTDVVCRCCSPVVKKHLGSVKHPWLSVCRAS